MIPTFYDIILRALRKKGYRSLTAFHRSYPFSFSYEYLRQIYAEERIPSPEKIEELATALGFNETRLQKLATEKRLEHSIRKHYRTPTATRAGRLAEKVAQYGKRSTIDTQILKVLEKMPDAEKKEVLVYLKFMRKQWLKKAK